MSITLREGFVGESIDRVLEDLLVRFVINCPNEDLSSIERVFFQIEEAHWFYSDFIRVINPSLPSMKMKGFSTAIIERCPMIWRWGSASDALARFGKYKSTIPVRGAALLNSDLSKILLVKGMESSSWGFPRGKISKGEDDTVCAIREVKEETGFDCSDLIDESSYAERTVRGKNFKIFFIDGVPEDFVFEPEARNEISEIAWMDLKVLNKNVKTNPNKYFLLSAMIKPIMGYVSRKKGKGNVEETKRRVAAELKALLGVTGVKEIAAEKANIDPGRELLEQLKSAINTRSPSVQEPSATMPNSQSLQQFPPFVPQQQPFLPFMPPAGLPFPFAPNMIPPGVQPHPPFFSPFLPQFNQNGPQFAVAPPPESLHKPSFSLANRRSKEADSKLLLGILNKGSSSIENTTKTESSNGKSKSDYEGFGDEEAVNNSKTNFLMGLFNKNLNTAIPTSEKKITILKRDPSNEPESPKLTASSQNTGANELLSLIKKSNGTSDATSINGHNNSNNTKSVAKSPNPLGEPTSLAKVNGESTSEDEELLHGTNESLQVYEDFEDFDEVENLGAFTKAPQKNLLHYDYSDDEYERESSDSEGAIDKSEIEEDEEPEEDMQEEEEDEEKKEIYHATPEVGFQRSNHNESIVEPVKKKIQILKRESTPNAGAALLQSLQSGNPIPNPQENYTHKTSQNGSETALSFDSHIAEPSQSSNSKSLLSLLQRNSSGSPSVQEAPSSAAQTPQNELLSLLKAAPKPVSSPTPADSPSSSAHLLSILKRPQQQSTPSPAPSNGSADLLSILKRSN